MQVPACGYARAIQQSRVSLFCFSCQGGRRISSRYRGMINFNRPGEQYDKLQPTRNKCHKMFQVIRRVTKCSLPRNKVTSEEGKKQKSQYIFSGQIQSHQSISAHWPETKWRRKNNQSSWASFFPEITQTQTWLLHLFLFSNKQNIVLDCTALGACRQWASNWLRSPLCQRLLLLYQDTENFHHCKSPLC